MPDVLADDPLAALSRATSRRPAVEQREARLLHDLAEMSRERKVVNDGLACEALAGLPPAEQVERVPSHFAALGQDRRVQELLAGCGWPTEDTAGPLLAVCLRTFSRCFLSGHEQGLRKVIDTVLAHKDYRDWPPVSAVGNFVTLWRETECKAWHVGGRVSWNEAAVRVLEFAAELDPGDLEHLTADTVQVIVRSLRRTGTLFSGGNSRDLRDWWARALASVTAVAEKEVPDGSPDAERVAAAAARWIEETRPPVEAGLAPDAPMTEGKPRSEIVLPTAAEIEAAFGWLDGLHQSVASGAPPRPLTGDFGRRASESSGENDGDSDAAAPDGPAADKTGFVWKGKLYKVESPTAFKLVELFWKAPALTFVTLELELRDGTSAAESTYHGWARQTRQAIAEAQKDGLPWTLTVDGTNRVIKKVPVADSP